jgi:NAD(P)-dependent dehydrogenase (short-subunit alcohol dehydrogenase family)
MNGHMRFSDKTAVVTGADSGIGRATATRLLAEGATVFAVDVQHTQPWPDPIAERLRLLDLDVADPAAPGLLEARLRAETRQVDVLANVAGILHIAPFLEVSREDWERVLAVNLTGVFFLTQAVARIMVEQQTAGRIVNVSSVHAVVSEPNAAPYTATKGGLEAMTRTMASELAPHGITVNCLQPGRIHSEQMTKRYPTLESELEYARAEIPVGRFGEPEEIAAAALFLASDESSFVTASSFMADGGLSSAYLTPGQVD